MEAFSIHPSRTEIAARLSPSMRDFDPAKTLAMAEGWTDWEKSRFTDSLINNWSSQDPKSAWSWYSKTPDTLPANAADQILNTWAQRNPNDMIQSLDTFTNPEDRRLAIEAISASLAAQGTDQALDWVESLKDIEERDAGMQAVYQNTPKGIGAVLKMENGFPKIADIMPTGALASTDLRAGDLIVQAKDSGKDPQDLYGRNMQDVVGLLRGTPGSEVEIRVLRENQATGQLEEHSAIVERDLLILESSGRN
jgi:C-terminal processing protease CtpA/Prc